MSRENQNLHSNKDYSELINACRGHDTEIDRFILVHDSPSLPQQLLGFAKRLATEKDTALAAKAAELLLIVHRASIRKSGDSNIDVQDNVRRAYQAVIARLRRDERALHLAVPLTICRSIEDHEGVSADNQGLIGDCERTIKTELKIAGEKCVRAAKLAMRDPDHSNKDIEIYCNHFVIYAIPLPLLSPRMNLFAESYGQTTKQLENIHLDAAILVDLPLASRLPETLKLAQTVLGNLSRRVNALITNLDHVNNRQHRQTVISDFLDFALSEFPQTNPTFVATLKNAQMRLDGQTVERGNTPHFSDYLAPQL